MTLKEAIEELEKNKTSYPKYPEANDDMARKSKADQLGIEALKRIANIRNVGNIMPGSLLPGETEK